MSRDRVQLSREGDCDCDGKLGHVGFYFVNMV